MPEPNANRIEGSVPRDLGPTKREYREGSFIK